MILFWSLFTLAMVFGFMVFFGAPYVPSKPSFIKQAFKDIYPISKKDTLVDIGSGDGSVLRAASKLGSKAVGFEINPLLYLVSQRLSLGDKNVKISLCDFWKSHLPSDTTLIYLFCVTRDVNRYEKKLQKEVDAIGHPIDLIVLGPVFERFALLKEEGPYHLYRIRPLQDKKA